MARNSQWRMCTVQISDDIIFQTPVHRWAFEFRRYQVELLALAYVGILVSSGPLIPTKALPYWLKKVVGK